MAVSRADRGRRGGEPYGWGLLSCWLGLGPQEQPAKPEQGVGYNWGQSEVTPKDLEIR